MTNSVNFEEVEKFSRIANEWWNKNGKFKPLHKFNPIRISYIKNQISERFSLHNTPISNPKKKLEILDIGCGGGLIAEPFARMGFNVTAIDASQKNIEIAKNHAEKAKLKIDYHTSSAEDFLANNQKKFDIVLALEIIEHVSDVKNFIKNCAMLTKQNGLTFIATMNRNLKSLLLAKIAAEYILRWLPTGTHDWKKFLKPSEINSYANTFDLKLIDLNGFHYNILSQSWQNSSNIDVNYIMVFEKF